MDNSNVKRLQNALKYVKFLGVEGRERKGRGHTSHRFSVKVVVLTRLKLSNPAVGAAWLYHCKKTVGFNLKDIRNLEVYGGHLYTL